MSAQARESGYPPRLRLLIASVLLLALPVVVGAGTRVGLNYPTPKVAVEALAFLVLAFLADLKPVPLDETGDRSVSLAFVFVLSSQILFGWQYAVLTATVSVLVPQLIERQPPFRMLFNTGVYALAAFASALPMLILGRPGNSSASFVTLWSFIGGAAFVTVNIFLVCLAVSFFQETPLRSLLADNLRHGGPAFLTMAFLAALAVVLWRLDPVSLTLLAGPLVALTLYQRSSLASQIATRHAHTDSLTGLGNHRAYELELASALEKATVEKESLALCLVDVDDFKEINDAYGHPAGDSALQELARLLGDDSAVRAFRLGGDEFALILNQSLGPASRYADELLQRIGGTSFPHGGRVTISVGVGVFPDQALVSELEHVVDSALYWAKQHGKNRLCVYDESVVSPPTPEEASRLAARQAQLKAAEHMIRAVDIKDTYTGEHSQTVSRLVMAIATELELEPDVVEQVRLAGLLHDLGKIGLPDEILKKPGKLTPHEQRMVRTHPVLGHSLLDGFDLAPVDTWILHHHEHWDGTGYPLGLIGEQIPLGSRIILVADAFDAMISERSYRSAADAEEALEELRRMAGHQFDPRVVAALEAHLGVREHGDPGHDLVPDPVLDLGFGPIRLVA
jgi:diguanylate cyclase (GGDEF)-like protein